MDYPIWCQCSHLFYKCCRIWEPLKSMGATDTKWVNENLNYTSSFFIFFDWDVKLLECFSNCFNKLLCNTSNLEQNTRYWNLEFTIEKLDKPFLTNAPFPTPWKRQRTIGFQGVWKWNTGLKQVIMVNSNNVEPHVINFSFLVINFEPILSELLTLTLS